MKKLILFAVLIVIAANGCKTRKSVQSSQTMHKTVKIDSTAIHKDSVAVDSSKLLSHVKKEDTYNETYEETNITIAAPTKRVISVPGDLHSDSTSTLDSLKYTDGKNPATSLIIAKDPQTRKAVATLQTPTGTQVFTNWSSIQINTKKYTRSGMSLNDSLSSSLLHKVIKNTFDTTVKHVDTTVKKQKDVSLKQQSETSIGSLFAAFWWIPVTLICVLLLMWKGGSIWTWVLKIFK